MEQPRQSSTAGPADSARVGSFEFHLADQRWVWSPAVAQMHGYEPQEITPTTELVMSHKHPDDKASVAALIEDVTRHGRPFSSRHRIIDTSGNVHVVVVVGDLLSDDDGHLLGTAGFYVDITEDYERDIRGVLDDAVADLAENRIAIEQAKTILTLAYGITADRAFEVLVWRSQVTNTKVRALANQFVRDVLALAPIDADFARHVDQLLLTAHTRLRRTVGSD